MSAVATERRVPPEERSSQQVWDPLPLSALFVTSTMGLGAVAGAMAAARANHGWATPLLWVGLLVIVLPPTIPLIGNRASRGERMAIVLMLGLALYAVQVLEAPNAFALHDELGHYRSVADILRHGTLYVPNPLVPAYAYYPGILTLTAAFARLSGLGIVVSGLIVVALARILLIGGLFLLIERVARSPRVAALAIVIYVGNPNFVYFDSQFAYESLALGLAAMTLWIAARSAGALRRWGDVLIAALLDSALVLTHHLTSYAVTIVLVLWFVVELARRAPGRRWLRVGLLAAFSLAVTGAYAVYAYHATASDIGGSITKSLHGFYTVVSGSTTGRHPFSGASGYSNPPLERVVGVASVALLLVGLPWGVYAVIRRRPFEPAMLILAFAALLYPVSLGLRLTAAGAETSNRTSEFLFAGLGGVIALAYFTRLKLRASPRRPVRGLVKTIAVVYAGIVFAGGIVVGSPPYQRLPGTFAPSAGPRSIDSEGTTAALWAASRLPPGTNFLADDNDTSLWTAHTPLVPQKGTVGGVGIGAVFEDPRFGREERTMVRTDKLRFLVVDKRDSSQLPRAGHYFDSADPVSGYSAPIPRSSLRKLDSVACLDRVFSSGHLVVYDARRVLEGCQ